MVWLQDDAVVVSGLEADVRHADDARDVVDVPQELLHVFEAAVVAANVLVFMAFLDGLLVHVGAPRLTEHLLTGLVRIYARVPDRLAGIAHRQLRLNIS